MEENKVRKLVLAGLMTALVYIATALLPRLPIPFTQGGYVHLGDSMIFIAAILLGWKYGAFVGGVGSALADILGGYAIWAIPTLIIKAIMGGVVGFMAHESKNPTIKNAKSILSIIVSGGWILLGFYLNNMLKTVFSDANLANTLIEELKLSGQEALNTLTSSVQTTLIATVIIIPLLIIGLFLYLSRKDKQVFSIYTLIGMTLGGLIMVTGYFIAESQIVGNMVVPIFSIPFNLMQFIAGVIIAFIVIIPLKKHVKI